MDQYSILDKSSPSRGEESSPEADLSHSSVSRSAQGSVSSALAAANALSGAHSDLAAALRFPGDDGGRSLAEMAERDLDAALQLLADRAQYITGASGAAIALRGGSQDDMLCRASAGSNAPELGAVLSAEFGLSGESVRTRVALRCDDTESDPRVNREGCRQLGIASVVVMPIASDDRVLGVFELFSGKVNAFGDRDLSALRRLGEMVETAVKLAQAAGPLAPEALRETGPAYEEPVVEVEKESTSPESWTDAGNLNVASSSSRSGPSAPVSPVKPTAPKKPRLWSAALGGGAGAEPPVEPDQGHVPPVLRNLRKCKACGFPVSEGRVLCVECEEKHWRGQLRVPQSAAPQQPLPPSNTESTEETALSNPKAGGAATSTAVALEEPVASVAAAAAGLPEAGFSVRNTADLAQGLTAAIPSAAAEGPVDLPVFASGIGSSESWVVANKYVLGALLLVAVVVAAIVLMR